MRGADRVGLGEVHRVQHIGHQRFALLSYRGGICQRLRFAQTGARTIEEQTAQIREAYRELCPARAADTTMAAVARQAGLTRRGLYLHFSSRAELLLALHDHVDERLNLADSLRPIQDAPDAVAALEEFVAHLARYHPKIQHIDAALGRARGDDPEVAGLIEQGMQMWHDSCRGVTQRLADVHRLAEPWTVDTATDLLWTFMFPVTLERLTVDRRWTLTRYQELLTVVLRRTIVADPT